MSHSHNSENIYATIMIKTKVADWTTEINHHGSFDTLLRITNNSLHFTVWKQLSTRQPARSMTNNAGTTSKGVTRNNGTDRRISVPAYLYVNYKRRVVWQCQNQCAASGRTPTKLYFNV